MLPEVIKTKADTSEKIESFVRLTLKMVLLPGLMKF